VLKHHHPYYNSNYFDINRSADVNIERLIEEALAHCGGYNRIDETGRDFDCPLNSDSKTATIQPSGKIQIGSVENKIGALRVVIFNPFTDGIDYFFIPHEDVESLSAMQSGKNIYKKTIAGHYRKTTNDYARLEKYRCSSFVELARIGTKKRPNFQLKINDLTKENKMTTGNSTAIDLAESILVSLGATNRELVRMVLDQLVLTTNEQPAQSSLSFKSSVKRNTKVQEIEVGTNRIRRIHSDPYYEISCKHLTNNVDVKLRFADGTQSKTLSFSELKPFIRKNNLLSIPCDSNGNIKVNNTLRYKTIFQ
jgi:hypothetical protein